MSAMPERLPDAPSAEIVQLEPMAKDPKPKEAEATEAKPEQEERRQAPRFTLLIQTAKLVSHHGEYLVIVRDASTDGVRVRHFGYLPPDEFIEFELANGQRFTVQLAWQDDEYAGLKFNDKVNLARIVKQSTGTLPKRQLRLETAIVATVSFADVRAPAIIRNISQQGSCIECTERMAVQQLVKIESEELDPVYAKVCWRKNNIYGLVFEDTLSLDRLAEVVAQGARDEMARLEAAARAAAIADDDDEEEEG